MRETGDVSGYMLLKGRHLTAKRGKWSGSGNEQRTPTYFLVLRGVNVTTRRKTMALTCKEYREHMFLGASQGASKARSRRNIPKTSRIDGSTWHKGGV